APFYAFDVAVAHSEADFAFHDPHIGQYPDIARLDDHDAVCRAFIGVVGHHAHAPLVETAGFVRKTVISPDIAPLGNATLVYEVGAGGAGNVNPPGCAVTGNGVFDGFLQAG